MNLNKTASASKNGVVICYTDVQKHHFLYYENIQVDKHVPLKGVSKYQQLEFQSFNTTQQKIYNEVVYGLSSFTEKELSEMSKTKKRKIAEKFEKAQRLLNYWKQEIINETVDNFLTKLFPKSTITKTFVDTKGVDIHVKNKSSFKDLKITRVMIASKLIEFNILPLNFFDLSI
jgi:ribosomal protein S19